jgi:hypothetical protein
MGFNQSESCPGVLYHAQTIVVLPRHPVHQPAMRYGDPQAPSPNSAHPAGPDQLARAEDEQRNGKPLHVVGRPRPVTLRP